MTERRPFQLDIDRIAEDAQQRREARRRHPIRSRVMDWSSSLLIILLAVWLLPLLKGDTDEFDPAKPWLWLAIMFSILFAAGHQVLRDRTSRKSGADPRREAENMQADMDRLTTPGWVWRILAMGARMGLFVGVPIGLLIAFLPFDDLYARNMERVQAFFLFQVLTFGWALPFGFVMRWLMLWSMGNYRVKDPPPADR